MTDDKKRYSLISVDTGDAEKAVGVRITEDVVDGEETIRVSSRPVRSQGAQEVPSTQPALDQSAPSSFEPADKDEAHDLSAQASAGTRADVATATTAHDAIDENGVDPSDEEVPFQRMQKAIVICLVAIIVVFLVYFNFFR